MTQPCPTVRSHNDQVSLFLLRHPTDLRERLTADDLSLKLSGFAPRACNKLLSFGLGIFQQGGLEVGKVEVYPQHYRRGRRNGNDMEQDEAGTPLLSQSQRPGEGFFCMLGKIDGN